MLRRSVTGLSLALSAALMLSACDGETPTEYPYEAAVAATSVLTTTAPLDDLQTVPGTKIVAGPHVFVRGDGEPITQTLELDIPDAWAFEEQARLVVRDVSEENAVSSGTVVVGGAPVFVQDDFPLADGAASAPVGLDAGVIEVTLAGKPGTALELTLIATYLPGLGEITPEGGRLDSSTGDAQLLVPPGAVSEPAILGIVSLAAADLPGDEDLVVLAGWELTPHGISFEVPVQLRYRVPDDAPDLRFGGGYFISEQDLILYTPSTEGAPGEVVDVTLGHFSQGIIFANDFISKNDPEVPTVLIGEPETLGNGVIPDDYEDAVWSALTQYEATLAPAVGIDFAPVSDIRKRGLAIEVVDAADYPDPLVDGAVPAAAGWRNKPVRHRVILLDREGLWEVSQHLSKYMDHATLVEGVILHMVGHHFGMDDNPTSEPSVMNHGDFLIAQTLRCYELGHVDEALSGHCAARMETADSTLTYAPGAPVDDVVVRVVDASGSPVGGAPIRLDFSNDEHGTMLQTDANGEVVVSGWDPAVDGNSAALYLGVPDEVYRLLTLTAEEVPVYGLFVATAQAYPRTVDMNATCVQEFGPQYRLTDWNDMGDALREGYGRDEVHPGGHVWVTRNGQHYWSGIRHYIASTWPVHAGYLYHTTWNAAGGTGGTPVVALGSWYSEYPVGCTRYHKPGEPVEMYRERFDEDPGLTPAWTLRAGEVAEWDPQGFYRVRLVEEHDVYKYVHLPSFGTVANSSFEWLIDVRVAEASWGMPIAAALEGGSGWGAGVSHTGTRNELTFHGGAVSYAMGAVQADVWYTMRVGYDQATETADLTIVERATGAMVFERRGVPFTSSPFDHVLFGDHTLHTDGRAAELHYDNVRVEVFDGPPPPPPLVPGTVVFEDDFEQGLGNWVERDPNGLGTATTVDGSLVMDYNITCGSRTCHQLQLLLADPFQPGAGDWRMEVYGELVEAYCCYNGGAIGNNGRFSLYVSDAEKESVGAGKGWQGLVAPPVTGEVRAAHAKYTWGSVGLENLSVEPWRPAERQKMTLTKQGDWYTVHWNHQMVLRTRRWFSQPPKVGFHTYGRIKMDDFRLYRLE